MAWAIYRLPAVFILLLLHIQLALVGAVSTIFDDTSAQILYSGPWNIAVDHVLDGGNTNYFNGATHTTTTRGASASFAFTGTGLTYFGDVDVDNAEFIVQLDGVSTAHTAKAGGFSSNQVLYTVSGLPNAQHTFTVTHNGANGEWATLDRLVVESNSLPSTIQFTSVVTMTTVITVGGQPVTTAMTSTTYGVAQVDSTGTATTSSGTLFPGTIAGIVIGCVVGVILLALIIILLIRHRNEVEHEEPMVPFTASTIPSWGPTGYKGYPEPQGAVPVVPISWHSQSAHGSQGIPPVPSGYTPHSEYDPYANSENAPSRSSAFSNGSPRTVHDRVLSMAGSNYTSSMLHDPVLNRAA